MPKKPPTGYAMREWIRKNAFPKEEYGKTRKYLSSTDLAIFAAKRYHLLIQYSSESNRWIAEAPGIMKLEKRGRDQGKGATLERAVFVCLWAFLKDVVKGE